LKRFILNVGPDEDGVIRLSGDDYHYLVRVRRVKTGDIFPALYAEQLCSVRVISISGGILAGTIFAPVERDSGAELRLENAPPPIVLFQALPRGAKTDLIVRQAVEGEISQVVLFVSERSTVRPVDGKEERWRRIVREARQQSGSVIDTQVRFCPSLDAALDYWDALVCRAGKENGKNSAALLLHEIPLSPLAQGTFHDYLGTNPEIVAVAAGPEGGFSPSETGRFLEAGFRAVRMGHSILRAETAALYGTAAARIILLEKAAWTLKKN
jgi:16S rRNA (uracil1498-N3)-methyltransferase